MKFIRNLSLGVLFMASFVANGVRADVPTGGCNSPGFNYRQYFGGLPEIVYGEHWYKNWHTDEIGRRLGKKGRKLPAGMRMDHLVSLASYGGGGHMALNPSLRNGTLDADNMRPFAECLGQALKKLPAFRGPVYRYVGKLPDAVDTSYVVGNVITELAFTSTSKLRSAYASLDAADKDKYPGYHYIIESKSGRELGWMVTGEGIQEVLFPAGTCFKVTARKDVKTARIDSRYGLDRYIEVHLRETKCVTR